MNIEYANTLSLRAILRKIGLKPLQKKSGLLLYLSPLDEDGKAIMEVDTRNNTWKDNVTNTDGGPLDFVHEYLKYKSQNCSIADVLQWLAFNIGYPSLTKSLSLPDYEAVDKRYIFRFKSSHFSVFQNRYLVSRCIPTALARKFLKEIAYINNGNNRECLALGIKNEEGGYAIRSRLVKAILGPRAVTVIHGKAAKKTAVHIFKDIYDYMSAVFIQKGKPFNNDAIILNSYSCLEDSARYIRSMEYRKVYTWLDNGGIGQQATKNYAAFCAALKDTQHKPMNNLYASAYDVNAWLVAHARNLEQ